jgi:hypothetical protein
MTKFRRLGSSSERVSFGTLLPGRATNVWAMGVYADDVSAMSTLGRVVWTLGSTADAFSPRMVKTS